MKWTNYERFAASNPALGACLDWHLNSRNLNHGFREFVEKFVKYAAVRPWDTLDFAAKSRETLDEWTVHFRIDNDEHNAVRLRCALFDGPDTTVYELVEGLKRWHGEWWAKQPGDHSLLITAIVRHREEWADERTFTSRMLDIYVPPAGYMP